MLVPVSTYRVVLMNLIEMLLDEHMKMLIGFNQLDAYKEQEK
jgi:hypothetical protein